MADKHVCKCIFCKELKKPSDEHVFPKALGGQLHICSVCKECNNYLGKQVDAPLIDNLLMQFIRVKYRLKGNSRSLPNPFKQGILEDNPKINVNVLTDKNGNVIGIHMVPFKETSDDEDSVLFQVDMKDKKILPVMVNKFLKRRKIPIMRSEEILEQALTKKVEPRLKFKKEFHWDFDREFLKIAYEIAYLVLGTPYLSDPIGDKIRKWVRYNKESKIAGSINIVDKRKIRSNRLGQLYGKDNCIISMLVQCGNRLCCYINFFNSLEGLIEVSEKNRIKNHLYFENNVEQKSIEKEILTDKIEELVNL
ncbi:HNH endonuclease [Sporolactobacillus sp. CQH2019]|uniref:HNH endonuclease n=1 Tax=Sporolactobacillus sp. CQH2019 TaxID=3023512 RepID=UPI002368EFF1|nr:HNH endonuclease [Sporolactobacillus sp. CQH2019]MDD9147370.1 HNH endonuclease [Sporolactobacillus sp. CQH2019]